MLLNADSAHAPIDIGERVLTIRSMFKKRAGRPRSMISSGAHGTTVPSEIARAILAVRWSPARSHAKATNAEPDAIPPNQKYSGTSHVHTGAFIIPRPTPSSGGISPVARASPA